MVQPSPSLPARVSLCVDDETVEALPLRLTGHEACVVLGRALRPARLVELELTWDGGGCTRLPATVRRVGAGGLRAELDLHGVQGDWRPFLDWLGAGSGVGARRGEPAALASRRRPQTGRALGPDAG